MSGVTNTNILFQVLQARVRTGGKSSAIMTAEDTGLLVTEAMEAQCELSLPGLSLRSERCCSLDRSVFRGPDTLERV